MGSPKVGLGLVGIELGRRGGGSGVAIGHQRLLAPVPKIGRGCPGCGTSSSLHVPGKEHVLLLYFRPEHDVLGVEIVYQSLRYDRVFLNLSPAEAVSRCIADQAMGILRTSSPSPERRVGYR